MTMCFSRVTVVEVLANDALPDGRGVGVEVLNGSRLVLGITEVLGGVVTYRANVERMF